jgi:hypothetical protein
MIESLLLRNNTLTELNNHLEARGDNVEDVIDEILGIKTPEYAELN